MCIAAQGAWLDMSVREVPYDDFPQVLIGVRVGEYAAPEIGALIFF